MKEPCRKNRRSDPFRGAGGFTLLELLVAMAVFAVIGTVAYAGLDSATVTEMKIDEEGRKWKNLSFFFGHLEKDLACFVDRPVTGEDGARLRAMVGKTTDKSGKSMELAFTRLGKGAEGSVPKRVGYRLNEDRIEALFWPSLDLAPGTKPDIYEAMHGVSVFEVNLNCNGIWGPDCVSDVLPKAVEVKLELKSGEKIRRIFFLR
ncbi:MAG: type II secretion system minor pseudopilin GspJ [Nitrospinae bacterium]|nr:type II secretion system minor pseudopilin GspJ [Nitrospinota bacterium]